MTLIKIALVGATIIALMVIGQNQRWYEKARIVGACTTVTPGEAQTTDVWYACKQGLLSGFPNLPNDTCSVVETVGGREIWSCTMPLTSLPGS
jgi:hypothetical protein